MILSGADWVAKFPTSKRIADLDTDFGAKVAEFIDALDASGAKYTITATLRPRQRAYLMHYSWLIWKDHRTDIAHIPAFRPHAHEESVNIEWLHRERDGKPDLVGSRSAAAAMVYGYAIAGLQVPPALASRHISGLAIDMPVHWKGDLVIEDAAGKKHTIHTLPRDTINKELIAVGKTFGVVHLSKAEKDRPHWSNDGH